MKLISKYHKNEISLQDEPFAGGGEGNLFHITKPESAVAKFVAKLYHPHKLGPERQAKLLYLYEHPPIELTAQEHPTVIWVHDLLYDANGKLLGFVMPFVKGEKLEILCTPNLPKALSKSWSRFAFSNPEATQLRLRLCFNISVALYQVHSTGQYVLVDLKPDNVVIQPHGLISLVDMDSVEVVKDGESLFDAPVATPEYTPPEFYIRHTLPIDPTSKEEWDLFSLAVIFYKLLLGIHPFAGGNLPPYDDCLTLEQKIEKGLFVHHPDAHKFMSIVPPPHSGFYKLPVEIQELFKRCFVLGHEQPELRPDAEEWCMTLLQAIDDPKLQERFQALFSIQHFEIDNTALRRHPSEVYSDLKIKEDIRLSIFPESFFEEPKTFPTFELQPLQEDIQKKSSVSMIFIISSLLISMIAMFLHSLLGVASIAIILSCFLIFSITLLVSVANNFKSSAVEKETLIRRMAELARSYQIKLEKIKQWKEDIKNFDVEAQQAPWTAFYESETKQYEAILAALDQQVQVLVEEEKKKYATLLANFSEKVLENPLFPDLKGMTNLEMKTHLQNLKNTDPLYKEKHSEFNELVHQYRRNYLNSRKSFDSQYHRIMDEARAYQEKTKDKLLIEYNRLNYSIRTELSGKTPISTIVLTPKHLDEIISEAETIKNKLTVQP